MDLERIDEAKIYLRNNWEKGCHCPCCGQRVQKYKFKFNSGMARLMIEFRKADEWIHVNDYFKNIGINCNAYNYGKLKFWGLIEKMEKDPGIDKNSSGFWRITKLGRDFVDGNSTIPSHVYFFNNKVIGFSTSRATIIETLGKRFSYWELMRG
jgi:hypothetical protein